MTITNTEGLSEAVTREDAIKFLECACRNWSKVPRLSEDDIGDVASELLRFALSRRAASSAGGVEVKALEWVRNETWAQAYCKIAGLVQVHLVDDKWDWQLGQGNCKARCETMEEAISEVEEERRCRILSALSPAVEAEPVAWQWTYSIEEGGRVLGPFYGALPPDLSEYPNQKVIPLYTHPSSSVSAEVTEAAVDRALAALWRAQGNGWTQHSAMRSALLASLNRGRENG